MDERVPRATALAVREQRLLHVGSDAEAMDFAGPGTVVVDLGGRSVLPGLIEGHMHYPGLGERLLQLDLSMRPRDAVSDMVKAEADRLPEGTWILGRGWNQEAWAGKAWPTRRELDSVAPRHPVALTRVCGHAVWMNSMALELAGVTAATPDPQGGEVLRDGDGEPIGVLTDAAMELVRGSIPGFGGDRLREALAKAQDELFRHGVTGCADAGSDLDLIDMMMGMYRTGGLKVRIYAMANSGEAEGAYARGPIVGAFDGRFTMRSVKLFADGSLGARSAWLLGDYSDRPGHRGNAIHTDETLYGLVSRARASGFQVATHAIGDAAVRQVLDTYERVLSEGPSFDHRWRVEHFQVCGMDDIERIARLRAIPAMQAIHAASDMGMAEDRLGHHRMQGAYAWRKAIDAGSIIVNGSDAPVEPVNPFLGIHAAVNRTDMEGNPLGGWYPGERMTRLEALKSFTVWPAYAQFEEGGRGSLVPGKLADFIVLDRDPVWCPAEGLKDMRVLMTVCGGETVYLAEGSGIGGGVL